MYIVRTIVCDPLGTGFYISDQTWHDPVYIVRERLHGKYWHWIGERSWHFDARNGPIIDYLDEHIDLRGWYDGMFDLVNVALPATLVYWPTFD